LFRKPLKDTNIKKVAVNDSHTDTVHAFYKVSEKRKHIDMFVGLLAATAA